MAHYLVTGGAGFIGSHLVEALKLAGHTIVALDNLKSGKPRNLPIGVRLYIGDVAEPKELQQALKDVTGIFHLAAIASVQESLDNPVVTHRSNLTGTVAVLDAASKHKIPVVYASSAAVYGDNTSLPLTENALTKPLSTYAADKLGSELHAAVTRHVFQTPTLGLRFFNVYGPRQDPRSPYSGVISIFSDRIAQDLPLTLHGDGSQTRDFIFVADVVQALIKGMELLETKGLDSPAVLNVCTGIENSVATLANTLMSVWGKTVPIKQEDRRAGDIVRSYGSDAAVRSALGIESWTPLKEGLQKLYNYCRETSEAA